MIHTIDKRNAERTISIHLCVFYILLNSRKKNSLLLTHFQNAQSPFRNTGITFPSLVMASISRESEPIMKST